VQIQDFRILFNLAIFRTLLHVRTGPSRANLSELLIAAENFFKGRMPFTSSGQQCQSNEWAAKPERGHCGFSRFLPRQNNNTAYTTRAWGLCPRAKGQIYGQNANSVQRILQWRAQDYTTEGLGVAENETPKVSRG